MNQLHNDVSPSVRPAADTALERLFELAVLLTEAMEGGVAARGLSRARAEVLWRLQRQGPMTQRELSQAMQCTPRNVTGLVDALQADGYVVRRPHPTDRRATLVTLTDRGATTAAAIQGDYQQAAGMLLDGVPADELTGFLATLDRIIARLRAAEATADQPR